LNFNDVLFFQAELAPDKLALVAHGSIIPYGRFVRGILSCQQRLAAIGVSEGQTVGIALAHPIDHLVVACALYRMRAASASIITGADAYLDSVPFDAVLADSVMPAVGIKQPAARFVLVDPAWFQDEVTFTVAERAHGRRDQPLDWVSRITCYPNNSVLPAAVKTTARSLEAQLLTYCLSAPPLWDRMISIAGLQTNTGFVQALSALWLGRSVCFTDVQNVRGLSTLYKHDYLVAPIELADPLLRMQDTDYSALHGLRAACFEGRACTASTIARGLTTICSYLLFRYVHPQIGVVAYGDTSRFKAAEGAVGFVAPWVEAQVVDDNGVPLAAGKEGALRFRSSDWSGAEVGKKSGEAGNGWILPRQRATISADNLLTIRSGELA